MTDGAISNVPWRGSKEMQKSTLQTGHEISGCTGNVQLGKLILAVGLMIFHGYSKEYFGPPVSWHVCFGVAATSNVAPSA